MKILVFTVITVIIWQCIVAPPVTQEKTEQHEQPPDLGQVMHYHRYLQQVVAALETDADFKKKLKDADEADIKSGKIANELEFVSHNVRTQLDELKRQELVRLRNLTKQKQQLTNNEIGDPNHGHLDQSNPHTFEIQDLKKLIAQTTEDLAIADRKRREEFKRYEMQKEYEKQDKLNHTNGSERETLEKEYIEREQKHKKHEPLHEPGHKAQLEEVWEEQDHMQQEFDPKVFFMMHDLDSNGLWDQDEVRALFIKELDKMYKAGAPEDDVRERLEEMERMRETVFEEMDFNKDGFIDLREFISQSQKQEFQQDNGWKGLDEQKPYTDEELEQYIRQQHMAYQQQAPPMYHNPPPGHYPPNQVPPGYPAYHPNQGYQPHGGQGNPQLNTNEIYHPGQQQYQQNYPPHHGQPNIQNPSQHNFPNQINPSQGQLNYPGNPQGQQIYQNPNINQINVGQQNQPNQAQQMNPNQQNYQSQNKAQQNYPNPSQQNQLNQEQQNYPNLNQGQQSNPNPPPKNQPIQVQQNQPNADQMNQAKQGQANHQNEINNNSGQ